MALAVGPPVGEGGARRPEAPPAWWALRGLLVAPFLWQLASVPRQWDGILVSLVVAAVAVPLSVSLGRGAARGEHRTLDRIASVLAAVAIPMAVVQMHDAGRTQYVDVDSGASNPGVLQASDGRMIFNIYPFASDGTPLEGVLLYDQDGMPLDNLMVPEVYDETGQGLQHPDGPVDANGNPITNLYPKSLLISGSGPPRPDRRPAVRIPPRSEQTTTTAAPSANPAP